MCTYAGVVIPNPRSWELPETDSPRIGWVGVIRCLRLFCSAYAKQGNSNKMQKQTVIIAEPQQWFGQFHV